MEYTHGNKVIFTGKLRETPKGSSDPALAEFDFDAAKKTLNDRYFYAVIEGESIANLKSIEVNDSDELSFSPSGEYFCRSFITEKKNEYDREINEFHVEFYSWENGLADAPGLIDSSALYRKSKSIIRSAKAISPAWQKDQDVATVLFGYPSKIRTFDAVTSKFGPEKVYRGIGQFSYPTEFGWLSTRRNQLLAMNRSGEFLGRVVIEPTFPDSDNPEVKLPNPRWILRDGTMKSGVTKEGLCMVYCKDNKAYCEPLSDFEKDPTNPPLPVVETIPFLKTD